MSSQIVEQCPKCGNYTQGVPTYSTGRKVVRQSAQSGCSQILGPIIGAVIGLPFGGIGAIPGAIIGWLVTVYLTSKAGKKAADATDSFFDNTTYTFTCLKCGKTWSKDFKTGETVDNATDEELEAQRSQLIANASSNLSSAIVGLIVLVALCVGDGWYLYTYDLTSTREATVWGMNTTVLDFNFIWAILAFVGIFLIVGVIHEIDKIKTNSELKNVLSDMTVEEFRCSPYRS